MFLSLFEWLPNRGKVRVRTRKLTIACSRTRQSRPLMRGVMRNKAMRLIVIISMALFSGEMCAANSSDMVEALKQYIIEKDYPEVFEDITYRVEIKNIIFDDLDGDKILEAIVQFKPHYRQSPTIVFYRILPGLKISRVIEGLAPGKIVDAGDYYIDSHTLGLAVDFKIEGDVVSIDVIKSAMSTKGFGGLVLYPEFIHADNRTYSNLPTFIDMSHLDVNAKDCEPFEFHEVNQIQVGVHRNTKFLAAWVGSEIYLYKINKFGNDGFIEKELLITQTPEGFKGFSDTDYLGYIDNTGNVFELKIPHNKRMQPDAAEPHR